MSKKVIGAAGIIAVILVIVLATIVPKAANARKIAEQLHLGDTYLSELEYDQAEAAYLAVIEIDPKNVDAYLGLADIYLAQGKYDEAIEILEQALDEIGDNEEIKRKLEEAEQAKKVAEVTPELTATPIPTPSSEPTAACTPEPTATNIPAPSLEPTATSTPTPSPEPTVTSTPTPSPEPTATSTPTPTPEPTATSTPTSEPTPTSSPTPTPVMETSVECFEWKEKADGTIEITKFTDKKAVNVIVPAEIEGKKVTSIGFSTFLRCSNIQSVEIPEGVTSIGTYAFKDCSSLVRVRLPETLVEIDTFAFQYCDSLETLVIPAGVTSICGHTGNATGQYRDECKNLKEFIVSEENKVFASVNGSLLTKDKAALVRVPWAAEGVYQVPDTVTDFGVSAFENCSRITEIVIPENYSSGSDHVFQTAVKGCSSLERFTVESGNTRYGTIDGVLTSFSNTRICSVPANGMGTVYTIPQQVVTIYEGAFQNCTDIETVVIHDYLEFHGYISTNGYEWSSLSKTNPFAGCQSLKEFSGTSSKYLIEDGVIFTADKKTLVAVPGGYESTTYTVPDGVEFIGHNAFAYCKNLMSITLPDSLKEIGTCAFANCPALSEITIPGGVTIIGANAFTTCPSLTTVVLSEGVDHIQTGAFSGCAKLAEIVIPSSVTEIGRSVVPNKTTIVAPAGTYAEAWAMENGYSVVNP